MTANKDLLANRGQELFDAADAKGLDLYFEAAVGGGIPLIRPLKESLSGERLRRVIGIVNGTTNFILTRMSEARTAFEDALADAQSLGYAEADPTADVDGHDAAAKCAILASIAFNARVTAADVFREGVRSVTTEDIEFAARLGYVIKLLAIAELGADERIAARVHPAMIPAGHPLASVRDANNAVFLEGPNVGELMFYGRGAGGDATATAVVGDLVSVARNLLSGARGVGCTCFHERTIRPMEEMTGQYYILLRVEDRPGVLAEIASVFGRRDVSIKSVWQEGTGDDARLVFITHRAREGPFQHAVGELRGLAGRRRGAERPSGRGRGVGAMAHLWRGVIEEYRDRLPVTASTPVVTLGEGGTPLVRSEPLSQRDRVRGLAEVRGREPDGLVQGPRDDARDQQGTRGGLEGGRVRIDREHERERGRVRGEGGAHLRRARAEGQGRARQDGRHARARRPGAGGRGELRRVARARRRPRRAGTRSRS